MESIAIELASSVVQSSLGFDSEESKLESLQKILHSLEDCSAATTANDSGDDDNDETSTSAAEAAVAKQSWIDLLNGKQQNDGEEDIIMLRDTFVKSLLENCHPNNNSNNSSEEGDDNNDGGQQDDDVEITMKLIETSFACLANLITLRCTNEEEDDSGTNKKNKKGSKKKNKKEMSTPIFGHDFVTDIATDTVEALKLFGPTASSSEDDEEATTAVMKFVLALLRVDRPRNEVCISTVRDLILLPASLSSSSSGVNMDTVASVAQILSKSITAGVITSVPQSQGMDDEELSMRRETAVLNHLQDMRDVFYNVASACSASFSSSNSSSKEEEDEAAAKIILSSIQEVYDIAEFAVESQLETLLGDKSLPITSRLTKKMAVSNTEPSKSQVTMTSAVDDGMDEDFDGQEGRLAHLYDNDAAAAALAATKPLYAKIAKPPVTISSIKQLESDLNAITETLKNQDAEVWDERLDALIHLECILAGGVAAISVEARQLFIEKIRKMPIPDQFNDLRSQITHQACRFIIAFLFEFRDYNDQDPQLHQATSHFVEYCLPSLLNLCGCAGAKVMSTSGMNCMLCLAAVCGTTGFSRIIPRLCDEILGGKKVHKNRKRGSIMALTTAVNVWESSCIVKHIDQLSKAVKEAATNSDPGVREEGRKFFWAIYACDDTVEVVEKMFDGRSREMKNLNKVRDEIDAEWEDDGVMVYLVEHGVLKTQANDEAEKTTKNAAAKVSPKQPKKTQKPAASAKPKRPASSSLKAKYGTPFKAQKSSTPQKSVKQGHSPVSDQDLSETSPVKKSPVKEDAMKVSNTPQQSVLRRPPLYSGSPMMTSSPVTARSPPGSHSKKTVQIKDDKENSPMKLTPRTKLNTPSSMKKSPIMGSPVVNLLARASPLSAEKIKKSGDVLGEIINMLSDVSSPQEQVLGIKALALFAKDSPNDPSWERKFSLVINCLIDQIRAVQTRDANDIIARVLKSPPKQLNSCQQAQHLFLQGVRSLLQFVPGHVQSEDVRCIVHCMLEVRTIFCSDVQCLLIGHANKFLDKHSSRLFSVHRKRSFRGGSYCRTSLAESHQWKPPSRGMLRGIATIHIWQSS